METNEFRLSESFNEILAILLKARLSNSEVKLSQNFEKMRVIIKGRISNVDENSRTWVFFAQISKSNLNIKEKVIIHCQTEEHCLLFDGVISKINGKHFTFNIPDRIKISDSRRAPRTYFEYHNSPLVLIKENNLEINVRLCDISNTGMGVIATRGQYHSLQTTPVVQIVKIGIFKFKVDFFAQIVYIIKVRNTFDSGKDNFFYKAGIRFHGPIDVSEILNDLQS